MSNAELLGSFSLLIITTNHTLHNEIVHILTLQNLPSIRHTSAIAENEHARSRQTPTPYNEQ
jgi:hypothetical protein